MRRYMVRPPSAGVNVERLTSARPGWFFIQSGRAPFIASFQPNAARLWEGRAARTQGIVWFPMSSTNDNTRTIETGHPNAATIQGLREVADWLEQHPKLPEAYYAAVNFRSAYTEKNAREELTALAMALGERAVETEGRGDVEISAAFGAVRVSGAAKVQHLRDTPPEPVVEYEPIIKVQP